VQSRRDEHYNIITYIAIAYKPRKHDFSIALKSDGLLLDLQLKSLPAYYRYYEGFALVCDFPGKLFFAKRGIILYTNTRASQRQYNIIFHYCVRLVAVTNYKHQLNYKAISGWIDLGELLTLRASTVTYYVGNTYRYVLISPLPLVLLIYVTCKYPPTRTKISLYRLHTCIMYIIVYIAIYESWVYCSNKYWYEVCIWEYDFPLVIFFRLKNCSWVLQSSYWLRLLMRSLYLLRVFELFYEWKRIITAICWVDVMTASAAVRLACPTITTALGGQMGTYLLDDRSWGESDLIIHTSSPKAKIFNSIFMSFVRCPTTNLHLDGLRGPWWAIYDTPHQDRYLYNI